MATVIEHDGRRQTARDWADERGVSEWYFNRVFREEGPAAAVALTPRPRCARGEVRRRVLAELRRLARGGGHAPTLEELGRAVGAPHSAVAYALGSLRRAGLAVGPAGVVRGAWVADWSPCAACAGLGVAPDPAALAAVSTSARATFAAFAAHFGRARRPPTLRDLIAARGLRGVGWVHHTLVILEAAGLLRRPDDRSPALVPAGAPCPACAGTGGTFPGAATGAAADPRPTEAAP